MDWENEPWRKLYTRPTPSWLALPWQSRALLPLMIKNCDHAGQIALGRVGVKGLAGVVGLPVEVTRVGLAGLIEDETVVAGNSVVTIANFVEAQNASTSDAERQRRLRDRRKVASLLDTTVTQCHAVRDTRDKTSRIDRLDETDETRRDTTPLSADADPGPSQHSLSGEWDTPPPKPLDADIQEVVGIWNETADVDFGRVRQINPERRKKIRAARKVLPDLDDWRRAVKQLNSWPFAHGQNDNGWRANFDYLVSNDKRGNLNVLALAEGGKGGVPKRDVTRGHQSEGDWDEYDRQQAALKLNGGGG